MKRSLNPFATRVLSQQHQREIKTIEIESALDVKSFFQTDLKRLKTSGKDQVTSSDLSLKPELRVCNGEAINAPIPSAFLTLSSSSLLDIPNSRYYHSPPSSFSKSLSSALKTQLCHIFSQSTHSIYLDSELIKGAAKSKDFIDPYSREHPQIVASTEFIGAVVCELDIEQSRVLDGYWTQIEGFIVDLKMFLENVDGEFTGVYKRIDGLKGRVKRGPDGIVLIY